jgi:integrase
MGFSLFRIKKIWHFRFYVGGKRIQKTTKETDRARAEEIAFLVYRRERLVKDGRGPVPKLRELVKAWISVHAGMVSAAHLRAVQTFSRNHLYDLGEKRIDRIRTETVEIARAQHQEGRRPASVNHWLSVLRLLYGWAEKRGLISGIPWRVRKQKLQKRPRVILPAAKAQEWLAAVDQVTGKRAAIATAIRLMLGLGLRESEALCARWEWIDWERGVYTPGQTKGREADPVPMPGWLLEYLRPRRRAEGVIAPAPHGGAYVRGVTRRVMAKANQVCGTPGLTPHRLRGTFATLLSEAGVPVQVIQRVMRHKDPVTTMGYLETDLGRAAAGTEAIGRRMGFGHQVSGERRPADGDGL